MDDKKAAAKGLPGHEQNTDTLQQRVQELEFENARLRSMTDGPSAITAKRDFLANMSHELRTPLNGMLGMAEILRDSGLNKEQREYVNALRQCGHDLLRIVNNLLDISCAEREQLKLRPRIFALAPTFSVILDALKQRAREKGLDFSVEFAPSLPEKLWGDPERLQQVLLNMVGNAVKFTNNGGVSIRIEPWEEKRDDSPRLTTGAGLLHVCLLHVEVRDTGIGIAADKKDDVFEAFNLSEALLTKKYAGAGLGLPISRHLARLMGGNLWFESAPGSGSTFHFTALLEAPFSDAAGKNGSLDSSDIVLRVLLVEDEEVSRFLARVMLERMGHKVVCAEDGEQAVSLLTKEDFDLVFMDIQMPVMDGIAATRVIRDPHSDVRNHEVPIVALTIYARQSDRERFLAAGMDEYMVKPVDKLRLEGVIAKTLDKKRRNIP